jgi:hypothetical protein
VPEHPAVAPTLSGASDVLHHPRSRSRSASTFCERRPPASDPRVSTDAITGTGGEVWTYVARDDPLHSDLYRLPGSSIGSQGVHQGLKCAFSARQCTYKLRYNTQQCPV